MSNLMATDGIEIRRDAYRCYSLSDLHRTAGSLDKYKPAFWPCNEQAERLVSELQICSPVSMESANVIRGGNNQETYVCKELVYAYVMWISPLSHLKVIRTLDMVTNTPEKLSGQAVDKMQAGVILPDFMHQELNPPDSSVLGICQKLQEVVGLPNPAPRYAIDVPTDAPDDSSRPTPLLSALLKQHGIHPMVDQAHYRIAKLGIVEQYERYSRTAINNIKRFWSLTAKGCMFDKNITSPADPRETQPHFFKSRLLELLKLLDTVY